MNVRGYSLLDMGIFASVATVIITVAVGYLYNEWAPLCVLILFLIFVVVAYNIYSLFDDYLPERKPKILKKKNLEDINLNVSCSRYIYGNNQIKVELNGEIVAKVFRGNSIHIPCPRGLNTISAYRDPENKYQTEIDVGDNSACFIWVESKIPPNFHVSVMGKDEVFKEDELQEEYDRLSRSMRGMIITSILIGTPSLFVGVWAVFSLGVF